MVMINGQTINMFLIISLLPDANPLTKLPMPLDKRSEKRIIDKALVG